MAITPTTRLMPDAAKAELERRGWSRLMSGRWVKVADLGKASLTGDGAPMFWFEAAKREGLHFLLPSDGVMWKAVAPFTPDEVEQMNAYQNAGYVHELTCGECGNILRPTTAGLVCNNPGHPLGVPIVQEWVWLGIVTGEAVDGARGLVERMAKAAEPGAGPGLTAPIPDCQCTGWAVADWAAMEAGNGHNPGCDHYEKAVK